MLDPTDTVLLLLDHQAGLFQTVKDISAEGTRKPWVIPTSINAVLCEIHRTWNRPEAAELAKLYTIVAPNYAALMESYQRAQDVIKQHRVVTGIPPKRESL